MVWVFVGAAALWAVAALFKVPSSVRALMLGVVYLGVLLAYVALPAEGALVRSLGGNATLWVLFGGVVAIIWLYRRGLAALKSRAIQPEEAPVKTFQDGELERYARHIVLREIGGPGQKRLKQARVLVVGAGGLGAPALQYLAAAGVGTIGVIDDDVVDNSNLQRQVIHKHSAIGMPKVFSAQREMEAQNPAVKVLPFNRRLGEDIAADIIGEFDLVLDGADNFETRYLVNRICAALKKPLIAAALSQWEGQISTYDPANGTPCYQCIFPNAPAAGLAPSCAEAGVVAPLPGVLGAMMAVEAIKEITGAGEGLRGRMMIYDALYGENRTMNLKRNPACPVCGNGPQL
jgi:molybdopterin/thiamine biosynthesis adenylyltransferase